MASYSYDKQSQELISYNTIDSVRTKAKYIKEKGLRGSIF